MTNNDHEKIHTNADSVICTSDHVLVSNPRRPQYLACGILCLGGILGGTVTGWSSTSIPSLEESNHFQLSPRDLSWIASIVNLGTALSAPITGYMIKKFGRKSTLLISAIPFAIGWAALAFPTKVWMLYTGRFLTGFADGSVIITASIYLCEIAEPDLRGRLSVVWFVMIRLGILFVNGVGSLLPYHQLSAISFTLSVAFGVSILFLPESPRWLMTKWQEQEATYSLCWLRDCEKSSPSPAILLEIQEIKDAVIRAENDGKAFKVSTYFSATVLKATLIACILLIFREASGGNVLGYFVVEIFEKTGSAFDPHLSGVFVGVAQLLAILVTIYYVDLLGRRTLLILTFVLMSLSLFLLGLFCVFRTDVEIGAGETQLSGWIPLILFITYNAAHSGGPFVLAFTVSSEVVPTGVIGFVSGLSTFLGFLTSFVLARYYEDMNDLLGLTCTFWVVYYHSISSYQLYSVATVVISNAINGLILDDYDVIKPGNLSSQSDGLTMDSSGTLII
ncbi:unnamed protein product [Orchesella dallaii]|uniref:Major facilitator superfamily (MFS) profile domain-containing protein n=1 Tax=Orchesella dallaii TaxID=48710 RepID=A0ABP1S6V4_9HEXA